MLRPSGDPTMLHGEVPDYEMAGGGEGSREGTDAVLEFAKKADRWQRQSAGRNQ